MKLKDIIEMVTTSNMSGDELPAVMFQKKKKKKKKFVELKEELVNSKFYYTNWKHNKFPNVKILDFKYPGRIGEKNYGKREDILGWNLNYYDNKEEAEKIIDDIDTFARMVSNNNLEKYKRIKYFFPEQSALLRRYKKSNIKYVKEKDGILWKKTTLDNLEKKHQDNL